YTDGCVYTCSKQLTVGSHFYYFTASDGAVSATTPTQSGPVVTNTVPALSNGIVSPANSSFQTTFTFRVTYTDADNNAPSSVYVYIDDVAFMMSKQTSSDTNYTDGCVYTCSKQLTVGSHFYYFTASDGAVSATTPTQSGPVVTNIAPTLSSNSVSPANGTIQTTFMFQVIYIDRDNNAPAYVNLNIDGTAFLMLKQTSSDTNYVDGCEYIYSRQLIVGSHSFYFTASDGAASATTVLFSGLTVTNTIPSLSNGSVSPANGTIQTTFTFQVTYIDADNNAPSYIVVRIDGTAFTMSKRTPSDTNFRDGCVYICSQQLIVGSHFYYFTASDGAASATTPTQSGPAVTNTAPTLSGSSASPASGTILTTFIFRITYTDVDNNAPSHVNILIDHTPFTMSKQTPSDTTYTDGCVYSYSKKLAIGSHSYYFTASDGIATTQTESYSGPTVTNTAPGLSGASVSPTNGTIQTTFTFQVTYTDMENQEPLFVNVCLNSTSFAMSRQNPSDIIYTDGCVFIFFTRLGVGQYSYYFEANDGSTWVSVPGRENLNVIQTTPSLFPGNISIAGLSNPAVATFSVIYSNPDNSPPVFVHAIIDGNIYPMAKTDSTDTFYNHDCEFSITLSLAVGVHVYYFRCGDGTSNITTSAFTLDIDEDTPTLPHDPAPSTISQIITFVLLCAGAVATVSTAVVSYRIKTKKPKPSQLLIHAMVQATTNAARRYNNYPGIDVSLGQSGQDNSMLASGGLPRLAVDAPVMPPISSDATLFTAKRARLLQAELSMYAGSQGEDGTGLDSASDEPSLDEGLIQPSNDEATIIEPAEIPGNEAEAHDDITADSVAAEQPAIKDVKVLKITAGMMHPEHIDATEDGVKSYKGHFSCPSCNSSVLIDEPSDDVLYTCRACQKPLEIEIECPSCMTVVKISQEARFGACPICTERIEFF
nr:hypothetical protein [Candidatus Sigynarchaeota archaeon]